MTDKTVSQSYLSFSFQQASCFMRKRVREFESILLSKIPRFVRAFLGVIGVFHAGAAYDQLLRQPNSVSTIMFGLFCAFAAGACAGIVPTVARVTRMMDRAGQANRPTMING